MRRAAVVAVCLAALVVAPQPAAYQHFRTRTQLTAKWHAFPVRYYLGTQTVPGVSLEQLRTAVDRGFADWRQISLANVSGTFGGVSDSRDDLPDIWIGFEAQPLGILGRTYVNFNPETGEMRDADIGVNNQYAWSVAAAGESGRHDLPDTLTHELGHLLGLAHSGLGSRAPDYPVGPLLSGALMFPYGFSPGSTARALSEDDGTGLALLYPPAGFAGRTGRIMGRVIRGGRGLLGAHLLAFDLGTTRLVGAFTLTGAGEFTLEGLDPGPKVLRVEPLGNLDVTLFGFDPRSTDVDFPVTYYPLLVVVPAGGAVGPLDVEVP